MPPRRHIPAGPTPHRWAIRWRSKVWQLQFTYRNHTQALFSCTPGALCTWFERPRSRLTSLIAQRLLPLFFYLLGRRLEVKAGLWGQGDQPRRLRATPLVAFTPLTPPSLREGPVRRSLRRRARRRLSRGGVGRLWLRL